ncbi:murein transglycosylase A [Pseudaquabacterium rugosum]|uniref:peptidoglycan lytic exotransglycosylase n=1 Tax=Pseudaquabacterium rugosum TaxID=2984194 RepID=A0ABU9BBW8_9BURK
MHRPAVRDARPAAVEPAPAAGPGTAAGRTTPAGPDTAQAPTAHTARTGDTAEPPPHRPAEVAAAQSAPGAEGAATAADPSARRPPPARPRARYTAVDWPQLPGWQQDRAAELWPALRAGCQRPPAGWAGVCARARAFTPPDDGYARDFIERELAPWRVEAIDGRGDGLATGYFEPVLEARRQRQPGFEVPVHRAPPDLAQRQPWWSRAELDREPARLRGLEIAWLAHPLDALLLQVQGSGRLRLTEPDGRQQTVRVAYAAHNGHPYRSVGRWLVDQGELTLEGASWPAIRAWGERAGPQRLQQMLQANPRVIFFREEPLADPRTGPRGAQGVPLTAGRSVAVDPQALSYGSVLWLDTTEPLSSTPLQRLVMAQDTGTAITGAVRIDLFFGLGAPAEALAGRMKQPLRVWLLWPREAD